MFGNNKPQPMCTKGYHVSEQFVVTYLEGFLNSLPVTSIVTQIVACGSAGQQVYVVYKI